MSKPVSDVQAKVSPLLNPPVQYFVWNTNTCYYYVWMKWGCAVHFLYWTSRISWIWFVVWACRTVSNCRWREWNISFSQLFEESVGAEGKTNFLLFSLFSSLRVFCVWYWKRIMFCKVQVSCNPRNGMILVWFSTDNVHNELRYYVLHLHLTTTFFNFN